MTWNNTLRHTMWWMFLDSSLCIEYREAIISNRTCKHEMRWETILHRLGIDKSKYLFSGFVNLSSKLIIT
jgi:hypothetical protein